MKNLIVSGATCVAFSKSIIKSPSVHLSMLGNRRASQMDTAGYSTVSASESAILTEFLSNSVTAGTARGYKVGADAWREYLSNLDSDSHLGEYLERVESQNGKAQRVVLFMAYLYMSEGRG